MSNTVQNEPSAADIIGDTVFHPERVKPLPLSECSQPIPKPNFFIIGTAKCGSTLVTSVLSSHPDCCHSVPKETNYFTLNHERGEDWYRGTFAHYAGEPVIGEASVSYTTHPFRANIVDLLYETNPDAKLIYTVRHPYTRLVSGWKMATSGPGFLGHRSAMKSFEAYVLHEESRHADGGPWENPTHGWAPAAPSSADRTRIWLDSINYEGYVRDFQRRFPADQIWVTFLEDWKADTESQARQLCSFLNLDYDKLPGLPGKGINRADQRRQVRGVAKFLADSPWTAVLRRLFPTELRRRMRRKVLDSSLGSKQLAYPDFHVTPEFQTGLLQYLSDKSASFLASQGKPADYWDFRPETWQGG